MKKKTALTLSAIALLSAGITFGVKFKQKKDFEKTLKTVLIPNAEKELENLLAQNTELNDSIDFYHALLLRQSSEADGQRIAEKHNKMFREQNPNMYSDFSEISKILKLMENNYIKEHDKILTEIKPYEIGEGEYDLPKNLQNRLDYLEQGITSPLADYEKDIPEIPGGYQQHFERGYNDVFFNFSDDYRFDTYAEYFRYELKATRGQFTTTGSNGNRVFYAITEATEIKQLLIAIKYFANNIDNSKHIINPEYIKTLNKQIDELMPIVEKQIKLESARDATSDKLDKFKSSKKSVENKIKNQQEKVKVLKTTDIKKLMKQYAK